jgi:hypothetical protein
MSNIKIDIHKGQLYLTSCQCPEQVEFLTVFLQNHLFRGYEKINGGGSFIPCYLKAYFSTFKMAKS